MKKKPKLHVCTLATEERKGLHQLLHSCRENGVELEVLGLGNRYRGLCDKIIYVQEYLETLPDTDVLMFVDAYDVLILASPEHILKTFLKMNVPFLISAERGCWPVAELASRYPPSSTSFKYLNSGTYIGSVGYMKELIRSLPSFKASDDDQYVLTLHYLDNPEKYTLDRACELFLSLHILESHELALDKEKKMLRCLETNTTPCVIHGHAFSPWYQYIYDSFFSEAFSQDKSDLPIHEEKSVFLAIRVRDNAIFLPKFLKSIGDLMYNKKLITLYIHTFNNFDDSEYILERWIKQKRDLYKEIIFETSEIPDLEPLDDRIWTPARFSIPEQIEQKCIEEAKKSGCDFYFVVDSYSFINSFTLKELIHKNRPIIAPMLRPVPEVYDYVANFVSEDKKIATLQKVGTFKVPKVCGTYLIQKKYLDSTADQYICNTKNFGVMIHFTHEISDEQQARLQEFISVSSGWEQ